MRRSTLQTAPIEGRSLLRRPARAKGQMFLSLAISLLLTACGGGGGGGGGGSGPTQPPPPPPPSGGASVTSNAAAGANSISLRGVAGTGDDLVLEVLATDVQNLYGVSFELNYPENLLDFTSGAEGSFLDGGGATSTSLQVFQDSGQLVIGLTRLGDVGGTGGTGVLLTLTFATPQAGSGELTFSANEALNPFNDIQPFVDWIDAAVTVN